jgi:hypothetical protein
VEQFFRPNFHDKVREKVTDLNLLGTPGPGAYILHSEFGTLKPNSTSDE